MSLISMVISSFGCLGPVYWSLEFSNKLKMRNNIVVIIIFSLI